MAASYGFAFSTDRGTVKVKIASVIRPRRFNRRRNAMKRFSLALLVVGAIVTTGGFAQATDAPAGMPWFFQGMPDAAQQAAWDLNKAIYGADTAIPKKYQQLIALAVSAQIPCQYCIYAHTIGAEKNGATAEEIREAVAVASIVRMWSTNVQGNQIDFDKFKATIDGK
jgi:AhpD family alkylhydroperoxidase